MSDMNSTVPRIDQRQADEVVYRVAYAAFTYYPEKPDVEPGYHVDEDVDWAVEPVRALEPLRLAALRDRVREVISNPTADRRAFIRYTSALAGR